MANGFTADQLQQLANELSRSGYLNSEQLSTPVRTGAGILEGMATKDYGDELGKIGQYVASAADPFAKHRPYFGGRIRGYYNDPSTFVNTNPAAQYNMRRVMDATNRSNAASGNFFSGNRMLELQENASGLGAREYDAEMERIMRMAGVYADPSTAALASSKYFDAKAQTPLASQAAYTYGIGSLIDEWVRGKSADGSDRVPAEQGILGDVFRGGGLDGRGDRGLIGDLGGLFSGSYGAGQYQGTPSYSFNYSQGLDGTMAGDGGTYYLDNFLTY